MKNLNWKKFSSKNFDEYVLYWKNHDYCDRSKDDTIYNNLHYYIYTIIISSSMQKHDAS